ncbi:MAG: hypothetical protein FWD05_05165 [Oscillospiraceae bacterium]|nr:hypothetical protein [Oscillospiraceae bacterium]
MFQKDFATLVHQTTQKCREYFRDRLCATYLTGSINLCEAIKGESDLDYWAFITGELTANDKMWISKTERYIDDGNDIVDGVHINVRTIEELRNDKFVRFALKYNSTLCYGNDIISEINASGADMYEPNKIIAKERLLFVRKCLEDAMKNICPQCMDKIPGNTYFAARKYARYFVIIEGAYYLMAINKFETYKQDRVIQQLKENSTGYNDILDLSLAVLENPLESLIKHDDYIVHISLFVKWIFDEIDKI